MYSRRIFFSVFAPAAGPAYSGNPVHAVYNGKLRRTLIWFRREGRFWLGELDHDRFLALPPVLAAGPADADSRSPASRIRVTLMAGKLVALDDRNRLVSILMAVPVEASPNIITPSAAHPDLTVLWGFGGDLYFTNNDYRNVYRLPPRMGRTALRPEKLSRNSRVFPV
jgi:hypothetical protein